MFLQGCLPSPAVWNKRWQGKWHALFPGAGLRPHTPPVRVDEATSAGSAVSRVLLAQVYPASQVQAARPTPESFEPPHERGRRVVYGPSGHQGAPIRRGAGAPFLLITQRG